MDKSNIIGTLGGINEEYDYLREKGRLIKELIDEDPDKNVTQFEVDKLEDLLDSMKKKHKLIEQELLNALTSGQS